MRSFRRVTLRVAPALASLASVLLLATCDFDKISGTPAPLTQQDIDRIFSITPTDTTIILGATTALAITPGAGIDLSGTTKVWTSSAPTVVAINEVTGAATGASIGNAVITARVIAPELDSGYSKTRAMRVRFKAIKACGATQTQCSPSSLDSIAGLNLTKAVNVFGTNNADAMTGGAITAALTTHDSGSTASTVAAITGTSTVAARKNGTAYVVAVFESMRDSIKVKVRQVAKSLTFPTTDYIANAINANRTLPITMRDVNDSVMTASPRLRFTSSDTSVVTIDSITGILRVKKNDTARIFVRVDTILNRSQKLRVQQLTATLTKFTTDPRSDTVARATTVIPTVTALDSGSTPVVGDTITFRSVLGRSVLTDSVRITDVNGRATLGSWKIGDTVGTYTITASSKFASATFTTTGLPQRAFGLRFLSQATDTAINAPLATLRVSVVDSLGNTIPTSTVPVTLALANNPGAATLNGTKTVSAVNGVATFTGLSLTTVGSGYTLSATAASLSNAISDAFSIYGTPAKLAFLQQPTNVTVNNNFSPVIRVAIQDANGTTVKSATNTVGLSLSTNPGGASFTGQPSAVAVGGIATFTTLSLNSVANNYGITAASPGLTSAVSNLFNVRAVGTAVKLAFVQNPPANVVSAAAMTPALTVEVQDADGARVTSSFASITLAFANNAGSGTLASTSSLTQSASNGLATFTGVSVDKIGTGYTLRATNASLFSATSTAFNVTPGAVTKLGFIVQPTHTNPNVVISPAVQVAAQDASGNTVPTAGPYTIAMTSSSGTLGGTTSRATVNGVATWDNLTLAAAASGLTLTATATGSGLTAGTSSFFNVVAASGGATRLRWFTSPANTTAGSTLSNVSVEVIDAGGARVTSATNQIFLTVASGPGSFAGTSTTTMNAVSGLATFTNVQLQTAGAYTLNANGPGFPAVASNSFTISAGTVNSIGFVVQPPATATSGAPISPAIQVAVRDAFGNTVPTATNSITLAFSTSPTGATLAGTATKSAVAGIATFDNLSTIPAGTYRFQATSTCCSAVFSDFFQVAAGTPTTLVWEVQPSNVVAGASITPAVKVRLQDASGNVVTSATNPVTIALSGGDATAALGGTKTQTPSSGVATFSDLTVNKLGTAYRLNASAAGFTTIQSNAFNATIGVASKVVFTVQPTNRSGGETFTIKAAVADAQGNIVTSDTRNIGVFITNGTGTSGATLSGNTFVQAVNGEATFTNVSVDKAGTGYQLTAFATGLSNATSDAFNITIGTASKLTFNVQPTQTLAGAVITPAVQVSVTDAGGNVVTGRTDAITVSKTSGTGHFQGVLSGTLTRSAVNGTATFNDLSIDKSSFGYRLTAVATDLSGAESDNFQITSGAASKVVVSSQPTTVTSLQTFTVNVSITDDGGNAPATGAIQSITAAILSGPSGAVLGGTLTQASNSGGNASFTNLTLDKAGTYTLRFTSGSLTAGTTASITVGAGQATQLNWTQQPVNTFLNAPLGAAGPLPALTFKDAQGNTTDETTFPNSQNRVQITIASGPSSTFKTSSGNVTTLFIDAVNGVVTIPATVSLPTVGTYILAAANNNSFVTTNAPGNSVSFTVSAFGAAAKLGFVQQPSTVAASTNISPAVTVAVQDAYGNTVTNATNSVSMAIGNDANPTTTLAGGGGTTPTSGIATFSALQLNRGSAGYTLVASSAGLTSATSNAFTVTGGPQGSWQSLAAMPAARAHVGAAAINNIMYVAGGWNTTDQPSLYAYDPVGNSWTTKTSMPAGRYQNSGTAVYNNELYYFGGWTTSPGLPNTNLYIYNPTTNTWRSGAAMPTLSACGAAGTIGTKIYVTTACDGNSGYRNFLRAYDPAANSWTSLPNSSAEHSNPAYGVIDGKLYVAGGATSTSHTTVLEVYDPVANTWTTKAPMPTAREGATGVVLNGKLYVIGGTTGPSVLNVVEIYDPNTNTWSTGLAPTTGRQGAAGAVISGVLYMAGGATPTVVSTLEKFTP